jgi:hypothetical protein
MFDHMEIRQWMETNQSNFRIYPTDIHISHLMVLC